MSGYKVERDLLNKHAEQLDEYRKNWIRIVQNRVNSAETRVNPSAFTAFGTEFVSAYNALIADYTTYIAGVAQSLGTGASNLRLTAHTYGMAESQMEETIRKTQKTTEPKPGGLEKLLP